MTKEEILAMEAGREIDFLVAVHVMNLCVLDNVQMYGDGCVMSDNGFDEWMKHPMFGKTEDPDLLEPYSTNISAAWEVFLKVDHDKERSKIVHLSFDQWVCCFDDIKSSECKSAPLAICKAALLAVMGDNQ
jgi:hypothetical protein